MFVCGCRSQRLVVGVVTGFVVTYCSCTLPIALGNTQGIGVVLIGIGKRTVVQTIVISDASSTLHPSQERGGIAEAGVTCDRSCKETVG